MRIAVAICLAGAICTTADAAEAAGDDVAGLLLQALLSLAIVVGVIYLVHHGVRRLSGRAGGADGEGPVQVVQVEHLGGDRWVYVLEVEGRRLLVGATGAQMRMLAELGAAEPRGERRESASG